MTDQTPEDGYEGVTHAGIALVRHDGPTAVFLARRTFDATDDPSVQETWEFPGGGMDPDEIERGDPFGAAMREFEEEIGFPLPPGEVTGGWRSPNGVYQCFIYVPSEFPATQDWQPTEEVQAVRWAGFIDVLALQSSGQMRPEMAETPWLKVFGPVSRNSTDEGEHDMDEASQYASIPVMPIPVHGVVAPEDVPTGDARGFAKGSMTKRPLRLPFRDTATDVGAHGGAFVVGSVDRLMRADGMVQWEGLLMPDEKTDAIVAKMQFFDGRYGVSVDGDQGKVNAERTKAEGMLWFEQVRAAGLTAVDIPAFHEAYVAFGYHPGMPADDAMGNTLVSAAYDNGDMIGGRVAFDRGPGWITDPKATKNIHDYWTKKGEEGYAKVGWGTPGDFTRAKHLIGAKIAQHSPEKMKYLNQIIAQWHHDALGYWPGDLGKPGNAPDTAENRRRAATHAALVEQVAEVRTDIETVADIDSTSEWEAVLVSSAAGTRVRPPLAYFHEYTGEDGAINIFEPDEFGFIRVTGFAADWGVCHIGMNGRCVEPPRTYSDDYPGFHKGRTKTAEGYIQTGVLTYGVGHRDAKTILSESADEAFFDNLKNAWAAVRVGENDRGIWFSGVVLPTVPEDDLIAIEASGQVSGEWLRDEMRACLTVNVRGFEVERPSAEYDEFGNVVALAASAFNATSPNGGDCPPTPAERMAAMRQIDAEIRFDALRAEYLAERGLA